MSEIYRSAQELAHLGVRGGGHDFHDTPQAFSAWFHTHYGRLVPQVADFGVEEVTCEQLQF